MAQPLFLRASVCQLSNGYIFNESASVEKVVPDDVLSFFWLRPFQMYEWWGEVPAIAPPAEPYLQSDPGSDFVGRERGLLSLRAPCKDWYWGPGSSSEILGALLSVLSIWVVTGVLVYLAAERLISGDYEIKEETMLITSGCAVVVNIM